MTEKEMNSYRFSPYQEPTDEMLEQIMKEVAEEAIMKEVAEEARESNRKATEEHWARMLQDIAYKQAKWSAKINAIVHGRE